MWGLFHTQSLQRHCVYTSLAVTNNHGDLYRDLYSDIMLCQFPLGSDNTTPCLSLSDRHHSHSAVEILVWLNFDTCLIQSIPTENGCQKKAYMIGRRHNFIAISCLIEVDSDYHQVNVSSLNAEVGLYEHECLYISHSQWNFLFW